MRPSVQNTSHFATDATHPGRSCPLSRPTTCPGRSCGIPQLAISMYPQLAINIRNVKNFGGCEIVFAQRNHVLKKTRIYDGGHKWLQNTFHVISSYVSEPKLGEVPFIRAVGTYIQFKHVSQVGGKGFCTLQKILYARSLNGAEEKKSPRQL